MSRTRQIITRIILAYVDHNIFEVKNMEKQEISIGNVTYEVNRSFSGAHDIQDILENWLTSLITGRKIIDKPQSLAV